MGWPLPVQNGLERDNFDRSDTVYVVAHGPLGDVCGCGRLLPTHTSYLLKEVFPELVGDMPLPCDPRIWELSRFAISQPEGAVLSAPEAWENTCRLMSSIVQTAMDNGAQKLIAFSAVGNERLLKRMGVSVQRIAAPQMIDDKPVVAFWIDIDARTCESLGLAIPHRSPVFNA